MYYHECWKGVAQEPKACGSPLIFNVERDYCDFRYNVNCPDNVECPEETGMNNSMIFVLQLEYERQ